MLLLSAVLLIPALIALRRVVGDARGALVADVWLIVAVPAAVLLGGQYAIDFIMPLIAEVGGEAHEVHRRFFTTEPLNTLFYSLPNLSTLGLLIMTVAVAWAGRVSRRYGGVLLAIWGVAILGGLVHPLVQRSALVALGVAFLPLGVRLSRDADANIL